MRESKKKRQEKALQKVVGEVTAALTKDLHEVIASTLVPKVSSILMQSFSESEFYRRISTDMQGGLKRIYKKISAATDTSLEEFSNKEKAEALFHEASEQLSEALTQTEQAAIAIMDVVERDLELQIEANELFRSIDEHTVGSNVDIARLKEINTIFSDDLNTIMLSLSFQDLTGQRIKRAVSALKEIEKTVVELYVSTGLLMQAYEEDPDRNIDEIETKTRQQVSALQSTNVNSELKGPTSDVSQKNIDDLLAQLGMD